MAKTNQPSSEEQQKPSTAETEIKSPNATEETNSPDAPDALEPKQGIITPADTRGTQPKRLRVSGFKGTYKGVLFNEEGESAGPVSKEVVDELHAQFPAAKIEEID